MLRMRRNRVGEALEGFADVPWHGVVDSAFFVVPFDADAEVHVAGPVDCHLVLVGDDVAKMLFVFPPNVLDIKFINYEAEGDWATDVIEQAGQGRRWRGGQLGGGRTCCARCRCRRSRCGLKAQGCSN